MTETRKLDLVQHIRPLHLMTLVVLYILGGGFGRYLGHRIDPAFIIDRISLDPVLIDRYEFPGRLFPHAI